MKKLFTLLFISFISSQIIAQQTVLARWNFEAIATTTTGTATPSLTTGSTVADSGALVTGSAFSGVHASAATVWSTPSGNGSAKSLSSNTWAIGDYYEFQASSTGYSNGISIKFDQTGSATGPANFKVQYSTDGIAFNDFTNNTYTVPNNGAPTPAAISWSTSTSVITTTFTFDLSSITALKNASSIYFRVIDNGTTSINGNTAAVGGTGRIDNFYIFDGAVVTPVTIAIFTGSLVNDQAVLNWKTATEINFNHFDIEKSSDASGFTAIATVTAKGSASGAAYSYTDVDKLTTTEYYRLKMVDNDGNFKYSSIVNVNSSAALNVSVFPNPVSSTALLVHPKATNGASIQVVSIDGTIAGTYSVATNATQTSFDVSKLAKGVYIVVYQNGDTKQTAQLIKE